MRSGYLYAVKFASGIVKIGRTSNVNSRLCCLRKKNGKPTMQYVSCKCVDSLAAERLVIKELSDSAIMGREWLDIDFHKAVSCVRSKVSHVGHVSLPCFGFQKLRQQLYKIREAADLLSIPFELLERKVECGEVRHVMMGTMRSIPVEEIERIKTEGVKNES